MKTVSRRYIAAGLCITAAAVVIAAERAESGGRTLGDPPPELNVDFLQGEPIRLEDGIGRRVFIVEFWATWCPPCRYTVPHLTELQRKYRDRGLVVIGISDETADIVQAYMNMRGDEMRYWVAVDRDDTTKNRFFGGFDRPSNFPTAFIVDGNGRVAWIGHPSNPFMEEIVANLVDDLPRIAKERAAAKKAARAPE
jgi:thiol-disulfide isomerase/thioredoxin